MSVQTSWSACAAVAAVISRAAARPILFMNNSSILSDICRSHRSHPEDAAVHAASITNRTGARGSVLLNSPCCRSCQNLAGCASALAATHPKIRARMSTGGHPNLAALMLTTGLRLPPRLLGSLFARGGLFAFACLRLPSLTEERMQRLARAGADVIVEERQHELEADQEGQRRDHDGAGRHQLVRRRRPPVIEPERQAEQKQSRSGDQLQRGQGKVAEEVAVEDAADRVAQVTGEKRRKLARDAQVRHLVAVGGAHRKFDHLGVDQAEVKQEIGLEEKAPGDALVVEQLRE